MNTEINDETPMPFGKHKGTPMADVPAHYLLWLYDWPEFRHAAVKAYIDDNMDVLKLEINKKK